MGASSAQTQPAETSWVRSLQHPMGIVSSNLIKTLPCIGARPSLNASIGCTRELGCGCGATDATRSMRNAPVQPVAGGGWALDPTLAASREEPISANAHFP